MLKNFSNGDLNKDIEKHLNADIITVSTDVMDNGEGEIIFLLDVNDDGYNYHNKSDRENDYERLMDTITRYRK